MMDEAKWVECNPVTDDDGLVLLHSDDDRNDWVWVLRFEGERRCERMDVLIERLRETVRVCSSAETPGAGSLRAIVGEAEDAIVALEAGRQEVKQLRSVIDNLCRLWGEGLDIDGGEFQDALESAGLLVSVPATANVLGEYGVSDMLVQRWRAIREHEGLESTRPGGPPTACRWCGVKSDLHDTPGCIHRLPTEEYDELVEEGYRWDTVSCEWDYSPVDDR